MRRMAMYAKSGFTLIELMLVVALISIITIVGIPNLTELFRKTELQRATSDFAGALRYAQQRAVMSRVPVRIVINIDEQRYYVPVEKEEERRRYRSRSYRRRNTRSSSSNRNRRVEYVNEINEKLPEGFIFEFVYHVANDDEIKRGEGEFYFYPDGSADAAYFTLLRLADNKKDERRVFIKVSPATGLISNMEGHTNQDGEDFYRGFYDDPRYSS